MDTEMTEKQVRNWFGDRGNPLKVNSKPRFKMVEENNGRWLFIRDNCFEYYDSCDEVELYFLDTSYCECYDSWSRKDFSWKLSNLISLIPKEEEEQ